jgi:hypothetical protein
MSHLQGRVCPNSHFNWLARFGLALLMAGVAHAVTITVPCSGSDGGASGLIAAINTANSTPGPNTINLAPGCLYALTTLYPGAGENGLPPITGAVTINGYGATIERSQAAGTPAFRILAVAATSLNPPAGGNLTLNTVTIRGGQVFRNDPGALCEDVGGSEEGSGGGICVDYGGTLNLNYSTVTENIALNDGDGPTFGGGIDNHGKVTLNCSLVSKNIVRGNPTTGFFASGGGISSVGELTLERSAVTFNTAETSDPTGMNGELNASGGGIYSSLGGTLTMHRSIVSNNAVSATIAVSIATALGAGIEVDGGTAILDHSVIRDNIATARSSENGFSVIAEGAGIEVESGTATLDHSLIFGNTAIISPVNAPDLAIAGGGGVGVGVIDDNGNVTLIHSVVHCNTVRAGVGGEAQGGGLRNGANSTVNLDHSKVLSNTAEGGTAADSQGGGIYNANTASGSVTLTQTQVRNNHPDQCDPTGSVPGCTN